MNKVKYLIWVDDEGELPRHMSWIADEIIICRTYRQAINALDMYCPIGTVYLELDHDLGCKQTGYDVAKYLVEHQLSLYGFNCHSFNPVGKKNIEELLLHYGYQLGLM